MKKIGDLLAGSPYTADIHCAVRASRASFELVPSAASAGSRSSSPECERRGSEIQGTGPVVFPGEIRVVCFACRAHSEDGNSARESKSFEAGIALSILFLALLALDNHPFQDPTAFLGFPSRCVTIERNLDAGELPGVRVQAVLAE